MNLKYTITYPYIFYVRQLVVTLVSLALIATSTADENSNNHEELPLFIVTTPSPITDYSTISNSHIHILESVFEKLGLKLQMQLVLAETTQKQFKANRYDGSIFIEGKSEHAGGIRIEEPLEYVYFDMFCLVESCKDPHSIPNNAVIAATGLGKNIIDRYFGDNNLDVVVANHPEHLLRLVKSGRAQYGFTGRPLLRSALARNENNKSLFTTVKGASIKRGLYLHLSNTNAEFTERLEQLLLEDYHPKAKHISNSD
ncbi:transporter substrate-binding domain-containing protein [Sessilibacter corallicola]|uniref:transporter substrate-binding domain-containing protein n=1 Tax=Sessilibacter corallicola TaxID=2904075 RepID=UPI001E3A2B1B|nr:transporter substrate-binding domain-containing protein [Sessilibacter corallicola]MCE2028798.1 transporter substrate-binding domain-containing protein [Sessilibacter corallicola]